MKYQYTQGQAESGGFWNSFSSVAPLAIHVKIARMSEIGNWMVFISTISGNL